MNLALLPARGGSKRLPDKNIMEFEGRPIIAYPLDAARLSGLFDKIWVSTDSNKIASVVTQLGFAPDFMRPDTLAGDMVPLRPVIRHAVQEYSNRGLHFDSVCVIFPCAVLLEPDDLIRGYQEYHRHDRRYDILTVSKFPVPIEWAFARDDDGVLKAKDEASLQIRSQDMQTSYFETGTFAIFNAQRILAESEPGNQFASIVLPAQRSVDIDSAEDLELARILFRGRKNIGS